MDPSQEAKLTALLFEGAECIERLEKFAGGSIDFEDACKWWLAMDTEQKVYTVVQAAKHGLVGHA